MVYGQVWIFKNGHQKDVSKTNWITSLEFLNIIGVIYMIFQ